MSVENESAVRKAVTHSLLLLSSNESHAAMLQKYLDGEHFDCTLVCKSEDGVENSGDQSRKVICFAIVV